ncbi:MAG: PEP-CTERM sorting domain-containing protein, partial [Bacteroidetes bacterium]|nr:PEP-CTERM sorting domain-containing protein [Bacteroidota bacterium]
MKLSRISLLCMGLVVVFILLLSGTAYAVPCKPGASCSGLSPEVGSEVFRRDMAGNRHGSTWVPDWIDFPDQQGSADSGDVVGISWTSPGFQADLTDPSNSDDSFFYYLHIERYRTYYEYDRFFQEVNNSCCSESNGNEYTVTYSTSYTEFTSNTVSSELSGKLGGSVGEIGGKIGASSTFGKSWTSEVVTGQKFVVNLDCCSGEAWWNQYKMIELEMDIGYQKDHVGYWGKIAFNDAFMRDKSWIGTFRDTINGVCVVPEPASVTLFAIGIVGFVISRR